MKQYILILVMLSNRIFSQSAIPDQLSKGVNFIGTESHSAEENQRILELYKGLRVADVSDGMDMVGLSNTGLVDASIHPSWVDYDSLFHQFRGIALTVRYVPTQKVDRPAHEVEFSQWEGQFYNEYSSETWTQIIQKGQVIVIDDNEFGDVGTIGSNNIMSWAAKGAVGVVTDAGARDTDEVALERIPLYLLKKSRGIRPGRNELESVNRPISIGGVLVCPGDVVVADGDGVIVVPRAVAEEVAKNAQNVLSKDKEGRRRLYERLGLPEDRTIR